MKVLITGIGGQDGSYLAQFLLRKGYDVFGLVRRASNKEQSQHRIRHILDQLTIIEGDLTDQSSINYAIKESDPDEVYNLGAQSFVSHSWKTPTYTGDVTGLGAVRVLEAIRNHNANIKMFQASSSEMFGNNPNLPLNEDSRFYPRSPYACAKVYAHYATINYRESYGLKACCGISFNHESVTSDTPVIIRQRGLIDVVQINEVVRFQKDRHSIQRNLASENIEVWDGNSFTKILTGSAYKHAPFKKNKHIKRITAGHGGFTATSNHVALLEDGTEIQTGQLKKGDKLFEGELSKTTNKTVCTQEEAMLLGMFVGDGSVTIDGNHGSFTNNSEKIRDLFTELWEKVACGYTKKDMQIGGFDCIVEQLHLNGASEYLKTLRKTCYTKDKFKRIPKKILNSNPKTMEAFLKGYNITDGLKAGASTYEFRRFGSNSQTLITGLWYLISNTTKQGGRLTYEHKNRGYFHLGLRTPNKSKLGKNLKRPANEIVRIDDIKDYDGWLYDLETESGTFTAGIGNTKIHNSPRRGLEFVTRKITDGVARIHLGLAETISLGNMDARRDFGYAKDYVEAYWLMLQTKKADDYVIATGESHSVREFVKQAFKVAGINDWSKYVLIDEKYMRPADVPDLVGDASKIKEALGWQSNVRFEELVKIMVEADIDRLNP